MNCFRPLQLLALSLYTRRAPWPRRARAAAPRNVAPLASLATLATLLALVALLLSAGPAQAASTTFNGSAVAGCSYDSNNKTYTCSALPLTNDTDSITVASGYTVLANPAVSFSYNQSLTLSGSAIFGSYGNLSIAAMNPANLHLSGGYLGSAANFTMGDQTISASIYAASISIGTGAAARVNGFVYATGAVTMASNVTVTGDVTGASLSLGAGASTINGNVSMSGDVAIGSGSTINGNLSARNVTTQDSNGIITGNASVNAITLGYGGRVEKTITCTGSGASGCSCVTNNSGYNAGSPNAPACTPPQNPPSTLDHLLISYASPGLTCQPLSVTVTACADAACSSNYTGQVNATLTATPGASQALSFTRSTTVNVQQTTAANVALAATGSGAAKNSQCVDTASNSSSCQVAFATSDLSLSVSNASFNAESAQTVTVSAVTSNNQNVCVPLFQNTTQTVNFSCSYNNPASGTLPVRLNGAAGTVAASATSCSVAGAAQALAFNASGQATVPMVYADVGKVTLTGSAISPATRATLTGSASFISAPDHFFFTATQTSGGRVNPVPADASGAAFVKAGENFTASLVSASSVANHPTPNFGNEAAPESYTFTALLAAPTNAQITAMASALNTAAASVYDNPAISGSFGPMSKGATSTAAGAGVMSWNASGILTFTAKLANTAGYLNSGLKPTGSTNVGRFIPDHLATTVGVLPMTCAGSAPACPSPNASGKFIYAQQPFDVVVTAYNSGSAVSKNYDNSYGLSRAVTLSAFDGAGATGAAHQNPPATPGGASIRFASGATALPAANFKQGVAAADSNVARLPEYDFAGPASTPPTTALSPPTTIALRATDTDNATTLLGGAAAASSPEALISVVAGRMRINNGYGAPQSQIPVTATAQYWTGSAYVGNPAYSNAGVALTGGSGTTPPPNVAFSNCTGKLPAAGKTCQNSFIIGGNATLVFTNGAATFVLAPVNLNGTVAVAVSAIAYLPSSSGIQTFGVYRAGPVIYLREVY